MTAPLLVLYATHDGHTALIARRISKRLGALGVPSIVYDLGTETPEATLLKETPIVCLLAPIRYGFHLRAVERFLKTHKNALRDKPLALASVNLTARKKEKNAPATNPYFNKWTRRHGLVPSFSAVFAGKLEYKRYAFWERHVIRFIMRLTGGPTALDAVVDFTNWDHVDVFAQTLAQGFSKERAA